ncbi:MAG: hypothetical protein ACFFCV_10955 [Promethearchaeota archaeon]
MENVIKEIEQRIEVELISIRDTNNINEIKLALEALLFVPNPNIRKRVISELTKYLAAKLTDSDYKIKVFIAYTGSQPCGFVVCQIDPYYTSYSRKCATFGWLQTNAFEICKELMKQCEIFVKENKVRKLRGCINYPKNLGGIGIQFEGFEQKMLFGVAFTDPKSKILEYLDLLGYKKESEYTCVRVEQKTWEKGRKIDDDIEFRYFTLKELYSIVDEIRGLAKSSFFEILPDSSGRNRIYEFLDAFSQIPKSFRTLPEDFSIKKYSNIPHFQEAWKNCDLEKIEVLAPLAFDKKTGELVGALLGLPDLFETYDNKSLTRVNVDTAMVKKGYYGKGIFSALNNIGQLTARLFGIEYYEGTAIWSNNDRAVNTIFPHCTPTRKHYITQKRV